MTAVLKISIDAQNVEGLTQIERGMEGAAQATDEAGEAAVRMRERMEESQKQQEQVIRVIEEHRSSVSHLAATVIPALSSVAAAGLSYAETLKKIAFANDILGSAIRQSTRVITFASEQLAKSQPAMNFVVRQGEMLVAKYGATIAGYGAAAAEVLPAITMLTIAVKGLGIVLDNTGKKTIGKWDNATADQIIAFNRLADAANAAGIDMDIALENAGRSWSDFGAKSWIESERTTTNLDRIGESAGKLAGKLTGTLGEGWTATKSLAYQAADAVLDFKRTMEDVEAVASGVTKAITNTAKSAGDAWVELVDAIRTDATRMTGGDGDAHAVEIKSLREQAALTKKLTDLHKENRDDFARLREVNYDVTEAAKLRARNEEVASIKSIEGIDAEIQKLKEKAGIAAQQGKFGQGDQKDLLQNYEDLEARRTQITRDAADERKRIADEEAQFTIDAFDQLFETQKLFEESRTKASKQEETAALARVDSLRTATDLLDEERAAYEDAMKAGTLTVEKRTEALQKIEILERRMIEIPKERAAEEMKMQVEASKQREDLMRKQLEYTKRADEEAAKSKMDEAKSFEEAEQRKREALEQTRKSAIERLQSAVGGDVQQARQQLDPRAVREQVAKQRMKEAENAGGGVKEQRQARVRAFQEFNQGKIGGDEIGSAQNELLNNQVKQSEKRGQVDSENASLLRDVINSQQQAASNQENFAQQIQQLKAAMAPVNSSLSNSRQRLQTQGVK